MDNNSTVLSKLDNQEIGHVFFSTTSDILSFIERHSSVRSQNVIFNLKNVLTQNKEEILRLLTHEIGKPISQCEREFARTIDILDNFEKIEVSTPKNESILILGSISNPIYELTLNITKYINEYSKFVYKTSSKAAITLNFIYTKMSEELGVGDRIMVASMTKDALDETLEKINFGKIIKYTRANIQSLNESNVVDDFSEKDRIMFIDSNSDIDFAVGSLTENISNFEKFNAYKIQHIFVKDDVMDEVSEKLIARLNLVLKIGKADDEEVNFSDIFKHYKRKDLKETLLELISLGAEIIYGSVEDVMTSPVIIKCDEHMEEYYKKDFWAPVIFLVEYDSDEDISMLAIPFVNTHKAISLLTKSNFEILQNSTHIEVEDLQNNV